MAFEAQFGYFRIAANSQTYDSLIWVYGNCQQLEGVLETYAQMQQCGADVTGYTFTALFNAYEKVSCLYMELRTWQTAPRRSCGRCTPLLTLTQNLGT
eukprot:3331588-Amphidinium_carterae.1